MIVTGRGPWSSCGIGTLLARSVRLTAIHSNLDQCSTLRAVVL
jgi:hypothetical protein